jgi:hypothetical protein
MPCRRHQKGPPCQALHLGQVKLFMLAIVAFCFVLAGIELTHSVPLLGALYEHGLL